MRDTATGNDQLFASRVAAEVRAEMARQAITQQALADRLGWQQPRLWRRITNGASAVPFTIAELVAVAEALQVPLGQFLPSEANAA